MTSPNARVLVVDDEPHVCRLIEEILAAQPCDCTCVQTAAEARSHLATSQYDVAVLDMSLADGSGASLGDFIAARGLPTKVIFITGVPLRGSADRARGKGACAFFEKPFNVLDLAGAVCAAAGIVFDPEADARSGPRDLPGDYDSYHAALVEDRVLPTDDRYRTILSEFAVAMVQVVEARDPYTRSHSEHTAFYAEHLACAAGFSASQRECLRPAALLHDIGKIAVPDSVLTKPGPLSDAEFIFVRHHPDIGADILENISLLRTESRIVRHHHEAWDGRGYPRGVAGEDIPLPARILNIADSVDAMLMARTYKHPFTAEKVVEELRRCAGKQFDPDLAEIAIEFCQASPEKLIVPDVRRAASA